MGVIKLILRAISGSSQNNAYKKIFIISKVAYDYKKVNTSDNLKHGLFAILLTMRQLSENLSYLMSDYIK